MKTFQLPVLCSQVDRIKYSDLNAQHTGKRSVLGAMGRGERWEEVKDLSHVVAAFLSPALQRWAKCEKTTESRRDGIFGMCRPYVTRYFVLPLPSAKALG
jgi:hypothetical protein